MPHVLAFHKLIPSFSYGVTNFSPKRLIKLLSTLRSEGWIFASLFQAHNTAKINEIALTFDDGYAHLQDILPTFIEEFGIRPTIFIPTALIGKSNRWDYSFHFAPTPHLGKEAIMTLSSQGVNFGSHGHTHCDLRTLSNDRLRDELYCSKAILEDITGREVQTISYPFGRFDSRVLEFVEEASFTSGFGMQFPMSNDTSLSRGRFPIYSYDTNYTIDCKFGDGLPYHLERAKALVTNKLSGGTILLHRLRGFKPID
ncbi:MAG: polysaccharide deacetylase family protein [candidate division Zixibacteria bacterium]|nr:polysaccharide deacetylase family protein [candidate division Zixibacteria bacterium]